MQLINLYCEKFSVGPPVHSAYICSTKLPDLKRIFVIIVLVVFTFSQAGYYIVMRNSQNEWKETMKQKVLQQVKDEALSVISLSDNQQKIYWEGDEKNEFSFNDEMYDLVKTVTVNGKVLLYCIADNKEDQLIDQYNSITKNNSAAGKKAKDESTTSLNLFMYEDEDVSLLAFPSAKKQFHVFVSRLLNGELSNTSPPPKA